ncbi:MAG: UDP-N-acetylglucosamine acyltransferase [Myxococcota bacterium]|jgi:UDP-N-acetylglucosamine acyltransferase
MQIHPTALVHADAEIAADCEIGPYAIIEAGVSLGAGVRIGPHSVVHSGTRVGAGTQLSAHVVLGGGPQDAKHDASVPTRLEIGEANVFREFTTAHRGSSGGRGVTNVGSRNHFMANSHIAHDCVVGSDCTFANSAAIAGHVQVGNGAILGGLCAVHQYTRVGRLAMIGGGAMCAQEVPPFTIAQGDRARLHGLNIIGLRRAGLDATTVSALKEAFRVLFVSGFPRRDALRRLSAAAQECAEVAELVAFVSASERGICRAALR